MERRFSPQGFASVRLQKRAEGDQQFPNIVGYAAVFYDPDNPDGTQYDLFGDGEYIERILPGAFDRAIRERDDVRALFNHDPDHLLGRTESGTLKLSVDRKGLAYEIDPPETQLGKHVTVAIERGDLTGSSFAFTVEESVFREEINGRQRTYIREIVSVRLYDVGPVTYPAYEGTSAELSAPGFRSVGGADEAKTALEQWRRQRQVEADRIDMRAREVALGL